MLAAAVLKCRPVSGGYFCAFGGVLRAVLLCYCHGFVLPVVLPFDS